MKIDTLLETYNGVYISYLQYEKTHSCMHALFSKVNVNVGTGFAVILVSSKQIVEFKIKSKSLGFDIYIITFNFA